MDLRLATLRAISKGKKLHVPPKELEKVIHLCCTFEMPRLTWLRWRQKGLGGSDMGAIFGLSKFGNEVTVFHDKVVAIDPERASEGNELTYWGNKLEPIIVKEFTERTGIATFNYPFLLQHPEHFYLIGNVDALCMDPDLGMCGFEAKTAHAMTAGKWRDGGIPDSYAMQCHHYMTVTGLPRWYIAALVGGSQYEIRYVDRDEDICQAIIKRGADFWDLVTTRTPPAIDGSECTSAALLALYPQGSPPGVELDQETIEWRDKFLAAKDEEADAKERKDEAGNNIKAFLGNSEVGLIDGQVAVKWGNRSKETIDGKALKIEEPDIAAKFVKKSSYRQLDVKDNREA